MASRSVERIIELLPQLPADASAATILAFANQHERRGPKSHRINYSLLRTLPNGAAKAGNIALALKGIAAGGPSQTGLSRQYAMSADLVLGNGGYDPFDTDLDPLVQAVEAVGILSAADVDSLRYAYPAATLEEVQEATALAAVIDAASAVQRRGVEIVAGYAWACVEAGMVATFAGMQAAVAAATEAA